MMIYQGGSTMAQSGRPPAFDTDGPHYIFFFTRSGFPLTTHLKNMPLYQAESTMATTGGPSTFDTNG